MSLFLDYFRLAIKSPFRNFQKNIIYGSLNILGLAIAFATLILVSIYWYQETNYESFHSNADRIFRSTHYFNSGSGYEVHFARVPASYVNHLPEDLPEVEHLIRFQNKEQKYLRIGEKRFKPKNAYVTDADVFKVFDFPLIEGDPETVLANPNSIVLTETLAQKYFSKSNVIGEEIIVTGDYSEEEKIFKITGIMKDLPKNTHLPVDLFFSFGNEQERSGWAYVYVLLKKGSNIIKVESKIPDFIAKYSTAQTSNEVDLKFQPLKDIHLESHLAREIQPNGDVFYIKIFFWVGLLVWIIALVNFTNLNTALAMGRGKEIGVRKVLGASKANLILLTLVESVVYALVALGLGGLIAFIVYPSFSDLTNTTILPAMTYFVPTLIGLALLSGLLAGILPALILASIQILQAIKQGNNWAMKKRREGLNVKRIMIAVQFCATIILIASAMVAHHQFKFISDKNLGLKSEQILAISELPQKVKSQYPIFKNRVKSLPGVSAVSACMQTPSSEIRDAGPVLVKGINEDSGQAPMMDMQVIDPDFIRMMGVEFLAGEDFTGKVKMKEIPEFNKDYTPQNYLAETPRSYLINETAMKQLGWNSPEEAIGQEIKWSIGSFELAYGPVKGVTKDFHQETLRNKIDPLVMVVEPLWLGNFLLQIETKNLDKTIASIEGIWNELFPYTLEYSFLDDLFNRLYQQDQVQLKLLSILTLIAIVISFIGLISLVAYALKKRSKELAIRRVIGADLRALITLIGKEYFWILAVAAVIGIPISYFQVSKWLENFAYHIEISPVVYLLSIALIYILLLLTIYLQTFKATIENPVHALRDD